MLYELIAVVRSGKIGEVKDIAKTAGMIVLDSGGVVRGYTNWNQMLLPRRVRKHQAYHDHGHYFVMRFDANAETQQRVRHTLGLDPRMVRLSIVKMGTKLDVLSQIQGKDDTMQRFGFGSRIFSSAPM